MKKTFLVGSIYFASVLVGCGKYQSKLQAQEASEAWETGSKTVEVVSIPSEETIEKRRNELEKKHRKEVYDCRSQVGYQLYRENPDAYIKRLQEKEMNRFIPKSLFVLQNEARTKFWDCNSEIDWTRFYAIERKGTKYMRQTRNCINEKDTSQFVCKEFVEKNAEYDWSKPLYRYFRY